MARILIVDDSPTALRMLRVILEGEKHEVITANDGVEGLGKVHQYMPDVVITDSVMPEMDGLALLRKIKEHQNTKSIPVIVLTAEDPRHSPHKTSPLQPHALVVKSDDPGPLLKAVRTALDVPRKP